MVQKTFGLAFAEARKQGLDKFEWKGGWYTTKRADESSANSHVTVEAKNRKKVAKNGTTGYVAKQEKNGDLNMGNLAEVTVTVPRLKLNRKTPGFLPVDENKSYDDILGNTRLYLERGTGRYLVTDDLGNIVGYSFDPAAATSDNNWGGWMAYTGSKKDLMAAGAGKLRDLANRNEDALKTKQAKDRKVNEWDRLMDGIRRMQGGFNTIQGMLNMPNNIITGAIRAGVSDDYSWDDYKDSFTIDGLWRGNSSVGLGDVLEIDNNYGRFATNLINPMSLMTLRGGTGKTTTKGKPYKSRGTTQNLDAHTVTISEGKAVDPTRMQMRYMGTAQPNLRGKYVGTVEGKGKMLPVSGNRSSLFSNLGRNLLVTSYENGMPRIQSNQNIRAEYPGVTMTRQQIQTTANPWRAEFFTPGIETTTYNPWMNVKPFNAAFRYDPKKTTTYKEETPTAEFYYGGNGNTNTYAKGRISTGKVVPGTSGKNWSGGLSGNKLDVQNTKGYSSPMFGGLTIGSSKDNLSTKGTSMGYLPIGYYKQGKKLITRKKS